MDRQKIVTFGEIMLRLTPPDYLRFNQTNLFRASYGGSEANVAVSLANYGLQSEFVTRLPDNRVADACIDDLRRYGVRTDAILRGGKRLGIYYMEEAAAMRSSHVVYDRADSAFDTLQPGMIDWDGIFRGASWFHWSGISAAVSAGTAAVCAEAIAAAHAAGLTVSCDINYRKNLWKYGKEPQEVLPPLMEQCDAFFGTDDEYEKVLGMQLPQFAARDTAYRPDTAGYERASAEVAARFPRCRSIVFGLRSVLSANHHLISGTLHAGLRHRPRGRLRRRGRRLRGRIALRNGRASPRRPVCAGLRNRGLRVEKHRAGRLQPIHGRRGRTAGPRLRLGPHRPLTPA